MKIIVIVVPYLGFYHCVRLTFTLLKILVVVALTKTSTTNMESRGHSNLGWPVLGPIVTVH